MYISHVRGMLNFFCDIVYLQLDAGCIQLEKQI